MASHPVPFLQRSIKSFIVLICLSFVFFATVQAQEGQLRLIKGKVKIIGKSTQILTALGATADLSWGDRIQTAQDSRVEIKLKLKAEVIRLYSNSFFHVEALVDNVTQVALWTGKSKFTVPPAKTVKKPKKRKKRLRRRTRFKVRTVQANVGVRGTEFIVGLSEEATYLLSLQDTVSFASSSLPEYEIPVTTAQASKVEEGFAPTPPVAFSPEQRKKLQKSDSSESFKEARYPPAPSLEAVQQQLKEGDAGAKDAQESTIIQGRLSIPIALQSLEKVEEIQNTLNSIEERSAVLENRLLLLTTEIKDKNSL